MTKTRTYSTECHIQIEYDADARVLCFKAPIFIAQSALPLSVRDYLEARECYIFKPHATRFQIEKINRAALVQKISFMPRSQNDLRHEIARFLAMVEMCRQTLSELVREERLHVARQLL